MKRFLFIGFIVVILLAIPLTIYILVSQQTNTKSGAAASSRLAFVAPTNPVVVGTTVNIPLTIDPTVNGGSNVVSFVKATFTYDGNKLQVGGTYFTNSTAFSQTLQGPTNTCDSNNVCTISVTVAIPYSQQVQGVTSPTTVGTFSFTPQAATDPSSPTTLNFVQGQQQILSLATADQPSENVFVGATALPITIISNASSNGTPVPTDTPNPSDTPYPNPDTPTPTQAVTYNSSNNASNNSSSNTSSSGPTCSSLTADQTSGTSPFTVTFTASGTSSSSTISQVTFNFGDGYTQNVSTGGGIGTANVSESISHAYQSSGSYTATAVFTDANGNASQSNACSRTITVYALPTATPTPTPVQVAQTNGSTVHPVTTVGATGPGSTFLYAGIGGAIMTTIGLVVLFIL